MKISANFEYVYSRIRSGLYYMYTFMMKDVRIWCTESNLSDLSVVEYIRD